MSRSTSFIANDELFRQPTPALCQPASPRQLPTLASSLFKSKSQLSELDHMKANLDQLSALLPIKRSASFGSKPPSDKCLTLHFVGVRPLKCHQVSIGVDGVDSPSIVTLATTVQASDTIWDLVRYTHRAFDIPLFHEIVILYAHSIVTKDLRSTLLECGITNRSLLTVAVSHQSKLQQQCCEHSKSKLATNSTSRASSQFEVECSKGFDVIMQQSDAEVFKMPLCGHVMEKRSLFDYAFSQLSESANLCLTCPHAKKDQKQKKTTHHKTEHKYECEADDDADEKYPSAPKEWRCSTCNVANDADSDQCLLCSSAKDWTCSQCHRKNSGQTTECAFCPFNKAYAFEKESSSLCKQFWDYKHIKQVLLNKCGAKLIDEGTVERQKEVQQALNEYYELRYQFSAIKWAAKSVPFSLENKLMQLETKIVFDFEIDDRPQLSRIRDTAKEDAINSNFRYPKQLSYKHKVLALTAKLELMASNNTLQKKFDLQKCPKCATVFYSNDRLSEDQAMERAHKDYEVQCPMCPFESFCWRCGKDWNSNHFCDISFKRELVKILANAQTKTIGPVSGVPSVRACPKCAQLLYHVECCKHMKCRSCKTNFCFVCLKPTKNGSWQCGCSSDRCPIAPRQTHKTLPCIEASNGDFRLYK